MIGFIGKKEKFEHLPIELLPPEELVLLWVDSYDCGWVCDIGWKDRDGKIWLSQREGSIEADMPYTLFSRYNKPEEQSQ